MPQVVAALAFALGALALALVFGWVAQRAPGGPVPLDTLAPAAYRVRRIWLAALVVLGAAAVLVTLPRLPYAEPRLAALGPAASPQAVAVTGVQYGWVLSQDTLPVGTPLRFDVTSGDVNHGFAIYDPDDHLVGQVQAMPGFTNSLVLTLDRPGTYRVRCLELCGPLHHLMQRTFCAGSCGSA